MCRNVVTRERTSKQCMVPRQSCDVVMFSLWHESCCLRAHCWPMKSRVSTHPCSEGRERKEVAEVLTSMCRVLGVMVDIRMGLGGVVGKVGGPGPPVQAKLPLGFPAAEPPKMHVHGIQFFGMMVLLATPRAVVLSVWIGNCGCGQPISMRNCRRGIISLAQMKRPEVRIWWLKTWQI